MTDRTTIIQNHADRVRRCKNCKVYGLEHSNGGLITFPGGVPLLDAEGAFIGSIGVSEGPNVPSREAA